MSQHANDKNNPDDPECTGVWQKRLAECSQVMGVLIERRGPGENLEVAIHVGQQVADQDQASDCHQSLERNS
jgi:hypothetical protein